MDVDELVWRIRNEPEWLVLGGVALLFLIVGGVYFTNVGSKGNTEARRKFNSAYARYQQARRTGNLKPAIRQLNQVISSHPESDVADETLFFLGKAYMEQGEYLKAMRQFQQLIDEHPQSFLVDGATLHMAYNATQRGKHQQALSFLDRLLNRLNNGPIRQEALWQKAMIELELKQTDKARNTLTALINQSEGEDSFWVQRARQLRAIIPS